MTDLMPALRRALGAGAEPVAELAAEHGAAFVGGWVRDALRGEDSDDVDLCAPDPDAFAAAFEAQGRRPVLLDAERRTWRIPLPVNFLDVSAFKGATLQEDLRKRDLTVNAIAWVPGRGLVDPLGGQADLAAGRLRLTGPEAIDDDRLRAVRLWRFAATLGATPEDPGATAVDLSGVADERVVVELSKLLRAPDPVPALRGMVAAGLLAQVLPAPDVDRLAAARAARFDGPEQEALDRCRTHVAALPDGELALQVGWLCAGDLVGELGRRRWPRRVGPHAQAVSTQAGSPAPVGTPDEAAAALQSWGCRVAFALLGRVASAPGHAASLLARLDASHPANPKNLAVPPLPRPLLGGKEVAHAVGGGPKTGAVLDELVRAQLAGRIRTEADARAWLTSR